MMRFRLGLLALALCFAFPIPAHGAATLEREFRYGPDRVRLTWQGGEPSVEAEGGTREFEAGRPDLPWIAERIELPDGMRITEVQVLELSAVPLAEGIRIPAAEIPRPGLGPIERSTPDPDLYATRGFLPGRPVELGLQGNARGRTLGYLKVSPARWDPSTGRLERIERVRVRLTLEPLGEAPLERRRVVPEWEEPESSSDGLRAPAPLGAVGPSRETETFKATQIPSVLGSPVAYVIVTDDAMAPEFQRLADWKTQSGVPAVVRTLNFIRQQYPFGADDAERVRLFIRDAYTHWGTRWVLLGGDTEVVPTRMAWSSFYGGENIACDMYFSCLDGNWNADGDSIFGESYVTASNKGDDTDLLPEVYVGRAPTVDVAQAEQFVDKTLQYIRNPVMDYAHRVLLFAEVLFPQDWMPGMETQLDGAELAEEILPYLDLEPTLQVRRLYENYQDARWRPGALQETRQAVIDSLDNGFNFAVHIGHGYRTVMSVGDANLTSEDALGLTNGNRLTNLYAINCTSNAIDFPSIGEAFLHAPNGGAVTNVGSTRFDFPTAGRFYQKEYFRLLFQEGVTAVGELQTRQKLPYAGFSLYDGTHRWTQFTLLLLGDPELRLYTRTPKLLTVGHPAVFAVSDTQFTVSVDVAGVPLAGARVTAYRTGDEYRTVITDGSGLAVVPFRPDGLGLFTLTVTAPGARPYQGTVAITLGSGPALAEGVLTIDDDGLNGTVGNGDGLLDAGETVDLTIPVRNVGSAAAPGVVGTLSTDSAGVTVLTPTVVYGAIDPGITVTPAARYRVALPYSAPDQREISFTLRLEDSNGRPYVETVQIVGRAPELRQYAHVLVDGDLDGEIEPGESVSIQFTLRNLGTGIAYGVSARLRSHDGVATITDSVSVWPDLAPGQESVGDAFVFTTPIPDPLLRLHLFDQYGEIGQQIVDLVTLLTPIDVQAKGGATSIELRWARNPEADLLGYNIYRASNLAGPFAKVNPVPTFRTSYYLDSGLAPLTRYYYQVTAVDSSGNESGTSTTLPVSTNPPTHAIFPLPLVQSTPAPIAIEHMYPGYPVAVVAGADKLYLWHPDGNTPVDADGAGSTSGDFSLRGQYFAAGASIGDIDADGIPDVVAPSWGTQPDPSLPGDSMMVVAYDRNGVMKPGWPIPTTSSLWSSIALGDLDNDGDLELCFGSNGTAFHVLRHDGTEWLDGDSNPATIGVFKTMGAFFNYSTPALADLDGNGQLDIVVGSNDGNLYAWRPDGTNLPGFPFATGQPIASSPAIGYLDGPGDTELDIVFMTKSDSLYVVRANGMRHDPFPVWIKTSGTQKTPSPALADMNNDGYLDIVVASTNGGVFVFRRDGLLQYPWANIRYSPYLGAASESSPVVADINGDGMPDVVIGDESGQLSALSGLDGAMLPGFPIQLGAEVKGPPAVCDCDGDGMTELVVAGWDRNVHMWDYDFPFSPGGPPPWPQFHHDARRTGRVDSPLFVDVPPPAAAPGQVDFGPPAPNPARQGSFITWAVPSERAGERLDVAVFDLSGRRVRTLAGGAARAGFHRLEWNLRDDGGRLADTGVYFVRFALGGESRSRKLVIMR